MKILDSSKSLSVLVNDLSNGLGTIQPLECTVTEELNGIYECEFTVLTTDKHYEDLKNSGLIKVTVGDGSEQIFRVYFISEPINFVVTVKAQHISYDLSKIVVKPFTATGAVNVKNQLVTHILGNYPFTTWTDITNTTSTFTLDIPRSFRECLGGWEGSVLDVFRCEYEWDNLTVKMYARRGADNGVRIAYGKNLTDFVQEQNNENVYDGVYGYAVVDEVTYEASNYYNKTGATTPKILNVDFSSDYETGQVPTAAELLQKATDYATNNSIEVPSVNIKIDFIPLWQTEEYKDILQLERVSLGDTVHVYFDKLNVEASSRVIKTVWNVLTNKYDSIELGDARANMNTIINQTVNTAIDEKVGNLDIDVGYIEQDLNDLGKLIINGLGLYFTREALPSGGYRFYLHNKPTLAQSDVQYYMSSTGLMMSNDGGQTWVAGYDATTGEMILQALSTITLRALEIYGSFLRFGDVNSNYIDVAPYSDSSSNPLGVSFDGTGAVRFRPVEGFYVENNSSSNYPLNTMKIGRSSSNMPIIEFNNYFDGGNVANDFTLGTVGSESTLQSYTRISNRSSDSAKIGNRLSMNVFPYSGTSSFNLQNYDLVNNILANSVLASHMANQNSITLSNYFLGSSTLGGVIDMVSTSSTTSQISIQSKNSAGNAVASILMNQDSIQILGAGLNLTSTGVLWIQSQSSQDIHISSSDDLYLNASDKIYWNGTQVGFRSDGSIGRLD